MENQAGQANWVPLPSARPIDLVDNVTLQPPLSRRGSGPGLFIMVPKEYRGFSKGIGKRTLDPEPRQKWAEEGFAVVEVRIGSRDRPEIAQHVFNIGLDALRKLPECTFDGGVGIIVYNLDHDFIQMRKLWQEVWKVHGIVAAVAFTGKIMGASHSGQFSKEAPWMIHGSGNPISDLLRSSDAIYSYSTASTNFILPGHEHYDARSAGIAHTRSLGFLKKHLGGPLFDLEAIWDEHTLFEFGERNVEKTMSTMVEEPYVNHVPTITGGIGRSALTAFYRDHFIFNNPEDTALELISRTVGVDRVIDEFNFSFTHDKVIDWLLPGVPPTNKKVRVPFTSVVNVRGDRLYHEHIAWDQASVLRQIGLLPEYLPFPYPLPGGRKPEKGKRFEYHVPVAGVETAMKLEDESIVRSNDMLGFEIREVDDV